MLVDGIEILGIFPGSEPATDDEIRNEISASLKRLANGDVQTVDVDD